jgi:HD-GYP domain-containing protein (c-di-GMP phosphodiesterase class II)
VALLGSTEARELSGEVPWYGALYNHASVIIPAVIAGVISVGATGDGPIDWTVRSLTVFLIAGSAYVFANTLLTAAAVALREGRSMTSTFAADFRLFGLALLGLAPLAWVLALAYSVIGAVAAVLFAVPLYTTRASYASVVEIRKMFTQTVTALASAIDARDPSTKKHSEHVSSIAVEIGQVLQLGEADIERLEWAGLLHDIGKIGISDAVLLKPDRLNREEREEMNRHPQRGWAILAPVERLSRERDLILHHHQWFNGSGYPRVNDAGEPVDPRETEAYGEARPLVAHEIPRLARILHVADAFEAMTAARPYRPVPLSAQQALAELRKYKGIQFDPEIVEAFEKTDAARGESEYQVQREAEVAAQIPQIGDVARKRTRTAVSASVPAEPS